MPDTLQPVDESWQRALAVVAHPDDLESLSRPVGARMGVTYAASLEVFTLQS